MTTLTATHPTLLDIASRTDSQGQVQTIAELLNETNEVLDDMVWVEANEITGHTTTVRTGLPTATWRKLYGGVQPSKSITAKIKDSCGMLEQYAEVDKALADLSGNAGAFRLSEERAFIEALNQEFTDTLFYGNESTEPEAFTGFSPRYNDQSAQNGSNILTDAPTPDSTDNSSIWLIVWGPNTVHGIYPKGSKAGIQVTDKGQVTTENIDGSNGRAEIYRTHYRWDCGLSVRDWRYVVRINIDEENLTKGAATGPDLIDLMSQAIDLIPSINMGRPVFYANRTTRGFIRRQIMNKTVNSTLSIEQITRPNGALVHVPMFDGIPIKRCDALLSTESGI